MSLPIRTHHLLVALLVLPALQGCVAAVAAVAVTVGYVQYERNEYEEELPLPYGPVWEAAIAAADNLGYVEGRTESVEGTQSVLENDEVWVRVEKLPFGKSRLRVRVGTFHRRDNARRARLIAEEVHRLLGLDPPVFGDEAQESAAEAGPAPEE